MKTLIFFLLLLSTEILFAQSTGSRAVSELPLIRISRGSSLHFRSPEPVQYADISDRRLSGDLVLANVLRLRFSADSLSSPGGKEDLGTVTIIAESFMAQYHLQLSDTDPPAGDVDIEILPGETVPLDPQQQGMSTPALRSHAMDMLLKRARRSISRASSAGVSLSLNQLYAIGDKIFLDLSFKNTTLLSYDTRAVSFSLEDKQINKATNHQSIEIRPVWSLYPLQAFNRDFRNIYVIDKLTFSRDKILKVTLSEKQLSARTVSLSLKYGQLLDADTF